MAKQQKTQIQLEEIQLSENEMIGNNDQGYQIAFPKTYANKHVFYCSTTDRKGQVIAERIVTISKQQHDVFERGSNGNEFEKGLQADYGLVVQIHKVEK